MKKQDSCSGCSHKDTCRQAYEKIGKAEGPNVTPSVILAFIVPIAVFIASLAISQRLLKERFDDNTLTVVGFFVALSVTLLVILFIRGIRYLIKKDACDKR